MRNLVARGRIVTAMLSKPWQPATIAFGTVSSSMLPMTLLSLSRGPTALDLHYSFALGAACLVGGATHDIVSGIRSELNSQNDAVHFRTFRSMAAAAATASVAFFVGKLLHKVGLLFAPVFHLHCFFFT